jgi:transcriptional regulator with XRE-family HTH domain
MDAQVFGDRVKAARSLRGWTQGDLCAALREHGFRYNDGNVRSWEKGRRWPEARAVPFIADVLGVSTDYLYGRDAALTPPAGASRERPGGRAPQPRSGAKVSPTESAARALAEGVTGAAELAQPRPPDERRRRSRRANDRPPPA